MQNLCFVTVPIIFCFWEVSEVPSPGEGMRLRRDKKGALQKRTLFVIL